jgi:hypothetical protein
VVSLLSFSSHISPPTPFVQTAAMRTLDGLPLILEFSCALNVAEFTVVLVYMFQRYEREIPFIKKTNLFLQVRSLDMDLWSADIVNFMCQIGNAAFNSQWEYDLGSDVYVFLKKIEA